MDIVVTLQEIKDKGDWDAYCEWSGTNLNEGFSGEAKVTLTEQEAIDSGMLPGKKTPKRKKLLMVDGPLLWRTSKFYMPGLFILFRARDYEASGGLHDAIGSYAIIAEAEGRANEDKPDDAADYHVLDTQTGEGWSLKRK